MYVDISSTIKGVCVDDEYRYLELDRYRTYLENLRIILSRLEGSSIYEMDLR
jgi:hypothetical protein